MSLHQEVIDICLEVIEMTTDEIGLDDEFQAFSHIDSLKMLDILTALERRFQIKIPEKEMRRFESINKIIAVVRQYVPDLESELAATG